jgi:hypothetical protein
MQVRRVVTGHDASGRARFVADESIAAVRRDALPGYEFHQLWQGDEPPRYPDAGEPPRLTTYYPPVGGYRFTVVTVPPAGTVASSDGVAGAGALAKLDAELPGLFAFHERGGTGMHKTSTIDFEVVIDGELTLELDDGASVVLHAGDTVVQNGTRQRWLNRSDRSATFAVVLSGAYHSAVGDARDGAR